MDDALRKQIIKSVVEKPTIQDIAEEVALSNGGEKKLFEFRNRLKQVHQYEKICKKDSEEWSEEEWNTFESWLGKAQPKSFESALDSVTRRKELREKQEEEEKSAIRKKIIECLKF